MTQPQYEDEIRYNFSFAKYLKGVDPTDMTLTRIEYGPGATVDQLIMAEAYMQIVVDRIKANGYEVPSVLANELTKCSSELKVKMFSDRQRQLTALKLRRDQLLPNDQKLRNIEAEIADLEGKLK